ncbi:hypothetical protein [Flavobacterium pectinovorum]|uniref:Uncharacterized protein n=1 Tax=Flavobacterium pectinovorum TaxID=29533 RepID=A0A502EWQ4_9FLAO|nr:hypothetical protein [Flavobacterium pectinovorum]TPG41542.1 hypothetical protein EAH81_08635 [Flavobacterium pectinovorum]
MKIKLSLLILIILQFSCKDNTEKQAETWNKRVQEVKSEVKKSKNFDFEKLEISKGQIGEIKVGMTINDAEKILKQLTKKEVEAYDFGFDGGGKAYLYSLGNEFVIGLVPQMDSKKIIAIIALSKNLKTTNGLNPKSTVAEIQTKYPDIKIKQNLMMEWESIKDKKNNWEFVFMTNENNQIGEYNDVDIPVKPTRTEIKADWITIK